MSTLGPAALVAVSAACTAYLFHVLYAIFVSRHLFGDASWFLLKMLSEDRVARWNMGLADLYVSRFGAFVLQEYPTLLFSRLGVTHLPTLSAIYGATLFAFKPLSLVLVYRYSRDRRAILFPLLTLFAGSMNSEAYIVTETHLFVALFWVALVILVSAEPILGGRLAVLSGVSLPLILCYETMALYGLVLGAACIFRVRRSTSAVERTACWIFFAWYSLGVVFAILSILNPRDPTQRASFLQGLLFVLRNNDLSARISCIVLGVVAAVLLVPIRRRTPLNLLVALAAALSAVIVLEIVIWPEKTNLDYHVLARSLGVAVPFLVVPLYLLWHFGRLRIEARQFRALFLITAFLGLAQSTWNARVSGQWSDLLTLMRSELREKSGIIPFETSVTFRQTLAGRPVRDLHGDWPVLPLGVVLARDGDVRALIDPGSGFFRPFDPSVPAELPALQRFGVRYDHYVAALPAGHQYRIGGPILFGEGGNSAAWRTGAWSYPEAWGTWSDGTEFGLVLNVEEPVDSDLVFTAFVGAFVNERQRELTAEVLVNGSQVERWRFVFGPGKPPYETRVVRVPKSVFEAGRPCRILFRLSKATSPAELGLSGDPRKVGLGFVRAKLDRPHD